MPETRLGVVRHNEVEGMNVRDLPWWEREGMLTEKDKEAIRSAKRSDWTDIDENLAETEAGRYELHSIKMRKFHKEEQRADML